MIEFLSINSATRVFVYDDYEIISFDTIEHITENPHFLQRFFVDNPKKDFNYARIKKFWDDFKDTIEYQETKAGPISIVVPTDKAIQKVLQGEKMRDYNPLDKPNIHTEISKVNNETSLLRFCKTYGIPFGLSPSLRSAFGVFTSSDDIHILMQVTNRVYNECKHLADLLHLWNSVRNKEEKYIREYWEEYKQLYKVGTNASSRVTSSWIDKAAIVLNELLKDVNAYSVFKRVDNEIKPFISFEDVLSIARYLLKKSIVIGVTDYKQCEKCGHLFETDHMKRRFCPPLLGKGRSSCENAHNQMKMRQRIKETTRNG